MPSGNNRHSCIRRLIRAYIQHTRATVHAAQRRRNLVRRFLKTNNIRDDSSSSSGMSLDSGPDWDDLMGSDWHSSSSSGTSISSSPDDMPQLLSEWSDSDDSSSSSSSDTSASSSTGSEDGDDEGSESKDEFESSNSEDEFLCTGMAVRVRTIVDDAYASCYEVPRVRLEHPSGASPLHHTLIALKNGCPDHFRRALCVTPLTFDKLVAKIVDDTVFQNNSNNSQLPVEEQLAVALYRFGHDGNAAGLQAVADWAGLGKGTVHVFTRRVMTAILCPEFMQNTVKLPTEEEISVAHIELFQLAVVEHLC